MAPTGRPARSPGGWARLVRGTPLPEVHYHGTSLTAGAAVDSPCRSVRFGDLSYEDFRAGKTADWAATASAPELEIATTLAPTFQGRWADLAAVATATCSVPAAT